MHKPISDDSAAERERVQDAIFEAELWLGRLFVTSWTKQGANTDDPKRELEHAVALVQCFVDNAVLDGYPFLAEVVREVAIPVLKRARPAKGRAKGRNRDSVALRDRVIADTVEHIHQKYGYAYTRSPGHKSTESAASITARALKRLGMKKPSEKTIGTDIWPKYRQ